MIWTVLWIAWGLGFFAIEIPALRNDVKGDTLSEHLRRWFRVDTHLGRTAWIVTSGALGALFIVHIVTRGWF